MGEMDHKMEVSPVNGVSSIRVYEVLSLRGGPRGPRNIFSVNEMQLIFGPKISCCFC